MTYLNLLLFQEEALLEFTGAFQACRLVIWLWRSKTVHSDRAKPEVMTDQLFGCYFLGTKDRKDVLKCVLIILRCVLGVELLIHDEAVVSVQSLAHPLGLRAMSHRQRLGPVAHRVLSTVEIWLCVHLSSAWLI